MKRSLVGAVSAVLLVSLSAGAGISSAAPRLPRPASATGSDYGLFLSILPPGQGGSTTSTGGQPPNADDQAAMYENLVVSVFATNDHLIDYFKPESMGLPTNPQETEHPRSDVTIETDSWGVPHIIGTTRAAAEFGAGYAVAEQRLFEMDTLRHVGRGRLSEFLGPSPADLEMDRATYMVAGYSAAEFKKQVARLKLYGAVGEQVLQDGGNYVAGINARIQEDITNPSQMPAEYPALQQVPQTWSLSDIVAVAELIQATFAAGGGNETQNALFVEQAQKTDGAAKGRALFRDLREAEDPQAPVTIDSSFPFETGANVDPAAVAMPDLGSVRPYDPIHTQAASSAPAGAVAPSPAKQSHPLDVANMFDQALAAIGMRFPKAMSNWLGVTGAHTASGHPIAVMGPQVGYFTPEILLEEDLEAPGMHVRGATFPGISLYVLLGRAPDFAWSATSGDSDLVDNRAEKLCNADGSPATLQSKNYVFNGQCVPFATRSDMWVSKPTASSGGVPTLVTAKVRRSIHGIVFARATVGGAPVALVRQRSTFMAELDAAVAFALLNSDQVRSARDCQEALAKYMTGSFNWLCADDRNLAYVHSGLYPVQANGVDPNFPSWGTGQWEWQGYVSQAAHPQAVDPSKGWLTSWNNKPARAWHAADNTWQYGTDHRVEMLSTRLAPVVAHGGVTPADVVNAMADAATVDLRGQEDLPLVLRTIGHAASLQQYLDLMKAWAASGAHRIDRDGDGQYEQQAAVALMDAWWPKLIHAMFDATLTPEMYAQIPLAFDDAPNSHVGSSYIAGWYGYVEKLLNMVLGNPVSKPYSVLRCADGTMAGCRAALEKSLQDAVTQLGPDPSTWNADEAADTIQFQAVGLNSIPAMPWQNRPTFQQVVEVSSHRPA